MVTTSRWPITVDGVRLDSYARNIRTRQGRDLVAEVRDENIDTGMRHGDLWVPGKKSGPGRMVLQMWVAGCDENGNIPADDDYWKFRQNLDALRLMFGLRHRRLDVRQTLKSDGSQVRQALAEVTAVVDPEMAAPRPYTAEMTVEFTIPDAWWQDVADTNWDSGTGIAADQVFVADEFAGATAVMEDLWVVVDGPVVNPVVRDYASGHYMQLNQQIAAGFQWVVNTSTWSSKVGQAIEFTDGGINAYGDTVYGGIHAPKILALTPGLGGSQVQVGGGVFGAGTRVRIRGKRKYQ